MGNGSFRGFTLVEMLISLALVVLLASLSVLAFSNFRNYFALRSAVQDVQTALIDARGATLASKDNTIHGVHVDADRVVRFVGSTYNSGNPSNIALPFPVGVTAVVTLSGGGEDILFTRLSGAAEKSGTIHITESRSGASSTVSIYASGLIDI